MTQVRKGFLYLPFQPKFLFNFIKLCCDAQPEHNVLKQEGQMKYAEKLRDVS